MAERLIWLVPLAVAVAAVWRPRLSVLVLAAALPLFGSPPGGPYHGALDVSAIVVILAGLRAPRRRRGDLGLPILAFAVCALASLAPFAYSPPGWAPGLLLDLLRSLPGVESASLLYTWRAALNLLLGLGLYWSTRRLIDGRSVRRLGLALAGGLIAVELLGMAAYAGLVDLDGYRTISQNRLHSLFFNSGWLAEYVVVVAPFSIAALMTGGRRSRLLAQITLVMSVMAVLFAQQRGGWLSALMQLLVVVLIWRGQGQSFAAVRRAAWPAAAGLALLVIVTAVLVPGVWKTLYTRATNVTANLGVRTHYWGAAIELTRERPVQGWGLGSFTPAYDRLRPRGGEAARRNRGTAHNIFLNTMAEQGLLGLAALLVLSAAVILALRAALRSGGDRAPPLAIGLVVSLVGFLSYGAVQYMFFLKNIAWLFWLLLAVTASLAPAAAGRRILDRCAAALVVLALVLLPYRLFAVEPLSGAGDHAFGFHELEDSDGAEPFRWAEARAARRVDWRGEVLILELANGHPLAAENPIDVTVRIDGQEVGSFAVPGGWQRHRLPVGPPRADWLVLSLETRPSFRPFSAFRRLPGVPPSRDVRSLAVAVREPRWE